MAGKPYSPDPVLRNYHDIKDQVQDGDLFFFRGRFQVSKLFVWLTHSYYSHVAVVAWWGDRLMILQAEGPGVQAVPLSVAVAEYPGRADWYRLRHESIPDAGRKLPQVLGHARADLGLKFGLGDALRSLFRWLKKVPFRNPKSPKALFCAEYVERSFRLGGVPLPRTANGEVPADILCWPQDLAISPLVAYQATIRHDPRVPANRTRDDIPVPAESLLTSPT